MFCASFGFQLDIDHTYIHKWIICFFSIIVSSHKNVIYLCIYVLQLKFVTCTERLTNHPQTRLTNHSILLSLKPFIKLFDKPLIFISCLRNIALCCLRNLSLSYQRNLSLSCLRNLSLSCLTNCSKMADTPFLK